MLCELLAQDTWDENNRLMMKLGQEQLARSTNSGHTWRVIATRSIKQTLRFCLSPLKNLIEWAETEVRTPVPW